MTISQNYKRMKVLDSLLGIDSQVLFSLIVFIGNSTFKTPMPENVTEPGNFALPFKGRALVLH